MLALAIALTLTLTLTLAACGGEETPLQTPAANPQGGNPSAQATATAPASASGGGETGQQGIDLVNADPCALLTREEAEAIMGPLDWKPTPNPMNDPTRGAICYYDASFQDETPEKNLAVRLVARNGWMDEFDLLQGPGTVLIPRADVGLDSKVALQQNNSSLSKLPPLCQSELPCVIADEAPIPQAGSVWMTLTAIMPDRSAFQIEIYPQNVDYASQMARIALERLPLK
jgi:hypothetical protein